MSTTRPRTLGHDHDRPPVSGAPLRPAGVTVWVDDHDPYRVAEPDTERVNIALRPAAAQALGRILMAAAARDDFDLSPGALDTAAHDLDDQWLHLGLELLGAGTRLELATETSRPVETVDVPLLNGPTSRRVWLNDVVTGAAR